MRTLRQLLNARLSLLLILGKRESVYGQCVNTPDTRSCWLDGFDINTDYEVEAPQGKLVEVNTLILGYESGLIEGISFSTT